MSDAAEGLVVGVDVYYTQSCRFSWLVAVSLCQFVDQVSWISWVGTGSYSDSSYSDSSYSDYAAHTLRVRIFWPNAHIAYFPTYCSKSGISHTFPAYPHYVRIFPAYFCIFSLIVCAYLGIFRIFFAHVHTTQRIFVEKLRDFPASLDT